MSTLDLPDNLLAKEKEFRRINEELKKKSKNIMLEIESVMNPKQLNESAISKKCYSKSLENINNQTSDINFENITSNKKSITSPTRQKKNEEYPKKDTQNETLINFLKTKVQMLNEELILVQEEYKKQSNTCKDLESEIKKAEISKKKLENQLTSQTDTIYKLDLEKTNCRLRSDTQKTEILAMKKEIEELKKELKNCQNQSSSFEVRLNRSLEDNDNLKSALKFSQLEEKELRDKLRIAQDSSKSELKNMEKQCGELIQAYKKQMLLVDNLKKQVAYFMANKQINLSESEFLKLLEWKIDAS